MTSYREILRLDSIGMSGRSIAATLGCSRNTVGDVISRALKKEVYWPISSEISDSELRGMLFPEKESKASGIVYDFRFSVRSCWLVSKNR